MNNKAREKVTQEEMQKACIRGLRDASVTKKRSNTMHDVLSNNKDSSKDDVRDDSTCVLSKVKEKIENSFDECVMQKKCPSM